MKGKTKISIAGIAALFIASLFSTEFARSTERKFHSASAGDPTPVFMLDDVNLLDNLGQKINGSEGGTLELELDESEGAYILTLDNFQHTSNGALDNYDAHTYTTLFAQGLPVEKIFVNLIGDSTITQNSVHDNENPNTNNNVGMYFLVSDEVVFTTAEEQEEQGSLKIEVNSGFSNSNKVDYAISSGGKITAKNCKLEATTNSTYAIESYGIRSSSGLNLYNKADVIAKSGNACINMACEGISRQSYGVYIANEDSGSVNVIDSKLYAESKGADGYPDASGISCGIKSTKLTVKNSTFDAIGGTIFDKVGGTPAGENYGTSIGVWCDTFTSEGGYHTIKSGPGSNFNSTYGVLGMNANSLLSIPWQTVNFYVECGYDDNEFENLKYEALSIRCKNENDGWGYQNGGGEKETIWGLSQYSYPQVYNGYTSITFARYDYEEDYENGGTVIYDGNDHYGLRIKPIYPADTVVYYGLSDDWGNISWQTSELKFKEVGFYTIFFRLTSSILPTEGDIGIEFQIIQGHAHNLTYSASGATITASCSADDCNLPNNKATLTLLAPSGDMHYDGNPKVATFQSGYNTSIFNNPQIKYYKDGTEVSECVNVGRYSAKVTYGGVTAQVNFEILGKSIKDPTTDVSVEIDDAIVPEDVSIRVEVRPDVKEKEIEADYQKIMEMVSEDERIAKVYDVKLIRTVGGVEEEIQPSDIQPGLKIKVRMAIPQGINMNYTRILHIHSVDDMEIVNNYTFDGNDLVFEISKLSQFAFLTKSSAPAPQPQPGGDTGPGAGNNEHGFCIAWVALILDILFILFVAIYLTLIKFHLSTKMGDKINGLVSKLNEKISGKETLIDYIISGVIGANFIFDLIILIAHHCPVSVVAFILALLLLLSILFLLLFFVFAKFIVIKEKEEEKVVRAIKIGSDTKDNVDYYWMMTFKFRRELKPHTEVFSKKQDAEEFLKNPKGQEEIAPSEDK